MIKKIVAKIEKRADLIAFLIILSFSLIYSLMSIRIHHQFQTFGWDLGVFDQGIWLWSKFKFPYTTFHEMWWLGDHFHLALIFLVPFYWLYENVGTLLIAQAFLTCFGGLPLYLLGKKITGNSLFNLSALIAYQLFYSLQWHTFAGFHELALLPLVLGGLLLFWETKKTFGYWLSFVILIFIKEELGFLIVAVGLWEILNNRKRWRQALLTIIGGALASFIIIHSLIPLFSEKGYIHFNYGMSGYSITDVWGTLLKKPWLMITTFFDSRIKLNTLWLTFWPWAFLPFFAPSTLILPFEQFASRFLDYYKTIRWTPFFAYSLPMATIMYWSSLYGFRNLQKFFSKKGLVKLTAFFIPFFLLVLTAIEDLLLHAPINSLFKKQFYLNEPWMEDNKKVFNCLPRHASVAAQNSLAPWLSQREKIKVLPEGIGYDFIVVDLHQGQSENNFRELGRLGTIKLVKELVETEQYRIICQENEAKVLEKIKE
jgi:uncharacterized membrane protein